MFLYVSSLMLARSLLGHDLEADSLRIEAESLHIAKDILEGLVSTGPLGLGSLVLAETSPKGSAEAKLEQHITDILHLGGLEPCHMSMLSLGSSLE